MFKNLRNPSQAAKGIIMAEISIASRAKLKLNVKGILKTWALM
jgi:hypothetical protein